MILEFTEVEDLRLRFSNYEEFMKDINKTCSEKTVEKMRDIFTEKMLDSEQRTDFKIREVKQEINNVYELKRSLNQMTY